MNWTTQRPKKPGFYWYKPEKRKLCSIYLVEVDEELNGWFPGSECERAIKDMDGEWQGPIQPDEAT